MQIQDLLGSRERVKFVRRNRRSKLEIYIEMLVNVKKGVDKPTQLMYASNLNWNLFKSVLGMMLKNGHVREIDTSGRDSPRILKDNRTKRIYRLTEKGEEVVKYLSSERDITRLLLSLQ
jgi:predicted transcriptional regulator